MSDARKFLTIPSQEALFSVVGDGRRTEERCSSPPDDDDDEEAEDTSRLVPRSSPVPRRRGLSLFEETAEYLKMRLAMATRRVSFADTSGGELVEVKEFVAFESDDEGEEGDEGEERRLQAPRGGEVAYRARADFSVPGEPALLAAVRANKVELESVSFPEDEPLSFAGLVRVLNVSLHKAVYVRCTMDAWSTFYDVRADYVRGSNDAETDQFSFTLSFAKPYVRAGARIEFAVRFETPQGDYWANNAGSNYSVTLTPAGQQPEEQEQEEEERERERQDAPAEKRRGILKASSYRMDTAYEDMPSAEKEEEETQKIELDVKPVAAIACPQIIHPEIDIENFNAVTSGCQPAASSDLEAEDGMTTPDSESLKEQTCSFSLAKESKDLTVLETSQPLSTQIEMESHQVPNFREGTEVPPDASTEDNVASMSDLSCSNCVKPFTSSVDESCTFNIVYSVLGSSFQGPEFVTPTKSTEKVPLEQNATQPPSLDALESDEGSQTLDTEGVTGERDQMSTMIQDEERISFGGLNLSETDLLHAADSSVPVRQENKSNYQDIQISQSESVHEMHISFTCLPEELGKMTTMDEHSTAGEKGINIAEASKKVENIQAAGEELPGMATPCMLDTPVATLLRPDDPMFQRQVGPEAVPSSNPVLPSFPKRDPTREMDEPSEVPHSTVPLAETMNFTSCAHQERISLAQLDDALEATESLGLATSVSASAAATVTVPITDIAIQSKNILVEDSKAMFSPNPESTDTSSLSTDSLRKEVSREQRRPIVSPLVSQKAESDVAVVRALVTAFVTFVLVVCLVMVIIDPSIFLVIGLYLLL